MENKQLSVEEVRQTLLINPDINLWDKMELVQSRNLEAVEIIKRIAREQLLQQEKETKLIEAIEIVCQALREDKDYYRGWQANIAMAFKDEFNNYPMSYRAHDGIIVNFNQEFIHKVANDAAHNFLKLLIK